MLIQNIIKFNPVKIRTLRCMSASERKRAHHNAKTTKDFSLRYFGFDRVIFQTIFRMKRMNGKKKKKLPAK